MLLPALIMFSITVVAVTLSLLPATFERKSPLVNFYWVGFWLFIALIAAISGAEQTVWLMGYEEPALADRLLRATTACFVIFVIFGWARLSGAALVAGAKKVAALV